VLLAALEHASEVEDWLWTRVHLLPPRKAVAAELRRLGAAIATRSAADRGDVGGSPGL
jgi:hypothetical protein